MTDDFEAHGEWWIPDRPDTKVGGVLRYSRADGAELTLLGRLKSILGEGERSQENGTVTVSMSEEALQRSGTYPRLHGLAGGAAYTLDDCFRTRASQAFFGGPASESIYVNRVLKGALFDEGETLDASGVSFGLNHLEEWIRETGIKEQWRWSEEGELPPEEPRFSLTSRSLPDRLVTTAQGHDVSLKHSVGISGDVLSARALTQGFSWRVNHVEKAPMEDLLDLASDLQDLVSIATTKIAAFTFVRFWHPDVFAELPKDNRRVPQPVELYAKWNVQEEEQSAKLAAHDLLFTFAELGGIEGVRRWMDVAGLHRAALGRVMATRYGHHMLVTDRVLNCAAALEAYDRAKTQHTGSSFKTRLKRSATHAGGPFAGLVGDVGRWAEAIRLERDDVAHHFGRRARSGATEPYYLWQSLYWLFVMCVLRDAGVADELFGRLQDHADYRWLRPRIQEVIG